MRRAAGSRPGASSPFFADHAISIVLYLGAFLVVTSVAIFLAYSWGDIDGGTKLGLLVAINAAFLGVAALCLRYPAVWLTGRTFLAIGALLVPANVGAAYILVFEKGPWPAAVFWLLGAVLSGGFHALLSVRLGSRAYGALATLAVPVAADALVWLVAPDTGWLGPPAALALVATLASTRLRESSPLAQAARFVSVFLLPLAALIALPTLDASGATAYAAPVALVLVSAGLAWEATRRGWTWWVGAATNSVADTVRGGSHRVVQSASQRRGHRGVLLAGDVRGTTPRRAPVADLGSGSRRTGAHLRTQRLGLGSCLRGATGERRAARQACRPGSDAPRIQCT